MDALLLQRVGHALGVLERLENIERIVRLRREADDRREHVEHLVAIPFDQLTDFAIGKLDVEIGFLQRIKDELRVDADDVLHEKFQKKMGCRTL
jgi:hypothetical protein